MRWPENCSRNTQDLFALPEAVKENAHRADIQRVRAEPDQVTVEARGIPSS